MTPLDEKIMQEIQALCLADFEAFSEKYLDVEKLKICKQREMGRSLQEIAQAMKMPKTTVARRCRECE